MTLLFSATLALILFAAPAFAGDSLAPGWEKEIQALSSENQSQARRMAEDLQEVLQDDSKNNRVYMNFDAGMSQEVFTRPGFSTPEECRSAPAVKSGKKSTPGCVTLGSVDVDSNIRSTGAVQFSEKTNSELEKVLNVSYEVTFDDNGIMKTGWIPADLVRMSKEEPTFGSRMMDKISSASNWITRQCDELRNGMRKPGLFSGNNINHLGEVHSSAKKWDEDEKRTKAPVDAVASKIAPMIGQCMISNAPRISRDDFSNPKNKKADQPIIYDEKVLPTMMQNFGKARDLNIPHLNAQSLVEIDSLARTIYAEMQSCVPIGSEYPMAVARIIKNRQKRVQEAPGSATEFLYEKDPHWPGKSISSKAAASPVQFSCWNLDIIDSDALKKARSERADQLKTKGLSAKEAASQARKEIQPNAQTKQYYRFNNTGLLHTLCPPAHSPEPDYTGDTPAKNQAAIWKSILKIATEATLYPKEFDKKTSHLEGIRHYTSDRTSFYDMKQVCPSIEGKQITNNRCLNLWVPPKSKMASGPSMACPSSKKSGKGAKPAKTKKK